MPTVTVNAGLGERIRELRDRHTLTQTELADLLGVAQHTVSNWESAGRVPLPRHMRALAKELGTSVRYLRFGEEREDTEHTGVRA